VHDAGADRRTVILRNGDLELVQRIRCQRRHLTAPSESPRTSLS
jgi:hypothetical protein